MTSFQEVPLQTSNFAHVIFQNVAKSYLPNAHLECHYTLTPYIHPHPKDWVGIFKVRKASENVVFLVDYFYFIFLEITLCVCVSVGVQCHGLCLVRGHLTGVGLLLLPCLFWGLNSGHRTWRPAPLHEETSL